MRRFCAFLVAYLAHEPNRADPGRAALAELASRNGKDLDGTPIIKTLGELEDLHDDGYVTIHPVATEGSEDVPWFSCPIITDPRDGAIASDSFVDVVKHSDGSMNAESIRITREFNCLKNTGDYCD